MKKMYVQEIIDYIENHIEEHISLDIIETHIGYSKYYLHKLFYTYTGMYVMDYCRRRKLEYSIQDLQTKRNILDIAIAYSYMSERSYSRAFKSIYGVSPGKYRNNTCVLTPKIELSQLGGIIMLPYLTDVKIVKIEEMYALGHRIISKEPESDIITYMTNFRINNKIEVLTEIGFDVPVTKEEIDQGVRGYEQWIVVDKAYADKYKNDTVKEKVIPKGKYMMLTISDPFIDPFERITNGWKKLISEAEKTNSMMADLKVCGPELYGFEEKIVMLHRTDMNLYLRIKD